MPWFRFWRVRKIKFQNYSGKKLSRFSRARLIRFLALASFFSLIAGIFLFAVLFVWAAASLPSPDKVVRREGFATKIMDRNGKPLYDVFAEQKRLPVELQDVPTHLRQATVAIEDKNFYKHQGFDPLGWLRAIYSITFRRQLAGGSTLTQQLVKNVLLTSQRTLTRKVKEFILAVQTENRYSKDQILQMYLNEAPYGGTAWGVAAAAESYFGKEVKDLNLVESVILAGLPQRPSYYSPFGSNPKAYLSRASDVLRRMREDGYLTQEQYEQALKELPEVKFQSQEGSFSAPHFVMYVKQLLEERYGDKVVEQGGLRVTTTLDLDIQEKAQAAVKEEIKKVESLHITNGAALIIDPQTGEILGMVGSKDYDDPDYDGKVNVVLSLRQPGSAIKPVTYLTAFLKGYTVATMVADVRTEFPGGLTSKPYVPVNYDGKDHGPVDLRHALGSSLNLPSVKLLAMVGVKDMLAMAYKMGLKTLEPTQENVNRFGLSVTLGGGEVRLIDLATAYCTFANSGYKIEPIAILKVEDKNGKILEQTKPRKTQRIISEGAAYLINNILADNNARLITFGPGSLLNIAGQTVAVKTGTTDDKRDNWTVGWTPRFLVGVWVGNNDNSAMKEVASGVSGASAIWRRIVLNLFNRYPSTEFVMPDGISKVAVDKISGYPSHDGFDSKEEIFLPGTLPAGEDPIHKQIKICRGQKDKLASDTMVSQGDFEEREVVILREEDPISTDGRNRWQEAINAWIGKQSDERYKVPGEYCGESDEVIVNFKKPQEHEQINSSEVEVEIEAVANYKIEKVEIYLDGDKKESFGSKPYTTKFSLTDGPHTLKAKAYNEKGNSGEREIKIGINKPWDWSASPSPSPTPLPSISPSPS